MGMAAKPKQIDLIGNEVAILWDDGSEDYFPMETLRAASPSAENVGETDIFGKVHGGSAQTEYPGVKVLGWEPVGVYAIRFRFSDGHNTGLYSYDYLSRLGASIKENQN